MRTYLFYLFLFFVVVSGNAQDTTRLTLDQCVDFALKENLSLKIQHNEELQAMYDHKEAIWDVAPTISGSGSTSLNLRRSTDQNNEIMTGTSYYVGYSISGSLTLFDGFTRINTIAAYKYNELAYKESTQYTANQLYLSIAEVFANVLYYNSLVFVTDEKLQNSKVEKERVGAMIEAGQTEQSAIYEITATVSENQLEADRAKNNRDLAILKLAQLLEWPDSKPFGIIAGEFDMEIPSDKSYNLETSYALACARLPQVKQKEYELEYLKKILNVYRGNVTPSLTLSGGYSSYYYSTDTLSTGKRTPFTTQFNNYLNPSLAVSLGVPIFSGFSKKYDIKRAKIDVESAMYELESERKQIRQELLAAIQRLEAYCLEYKNATDNLAYVMKSFEAARDKYHLGLINTTDFTTAQNQLAQARVTVANAKYNWIFQEKTIKLYIGETVFQENWKK